MKNVSTVNVEVMTATNVLDHVQTVVRKVIGQSHAHNPKELYFVIIAVNLAMERVYALGTKSVTTAKEGVILQMSVITLVASVDLTTT